VFAQQVEAQSFPPNHPDDIITWEYVGDGNYFYDQADGGMKNTPHWGAQYAYTWAGYYAKFNFGDWHDGEGLGYTIRWSEDGGGYLGYATGGDWVTYSRKERARRYAAMIATARSATQSNHGLLPGHGPEHFIRVRGAFHGEIANNTSDLPPFSTSGIAHDDGDWHTDNKKEWMGSNMSEGSIQEFGDRHNALAKSWNIAIGLDCGSYDLAKFITKNRGAAPPMLPIVSASHSGYNVWIRHAGGLAIHPDCGDENSPFPRSCIAAHAQDYRHAFAIRMGVPRDENDEKIARYDDATQMFFIPLSEINPDMSPEYSWMGVLGRSVSVDMYIRKIVPGVTRNGNPVFPTQHAPSVSTTVPVLTPHWPMPSGLGEDHSVWMTPWHGTEFSQVVGGEQTGGEFGYDTDNHNEWNWSVDANPTAQKASAWGGSNDAAGVIPLDVRAIRGRGSDTGDDGLSVLDPDTSTWVYPEAIEYVPGDDYTFRIQLYTGAHQHSGDPSMLRGSLEVWSATSLAPERDSFDLIYSQSNIDTQEWENNFQEYTFNYTIPSENYTRPGEPPHIALRVIFRASRGTAASGAVSEWPTQSNYYLYTGAVAGYEGLPTVAPIAEPMVIGKSPETGEIEDYELEIIPTLRYQGHIYEMPRGTSVDSAPSTPIPNVPVELNGVHKDSSGNVLDTVYMSTNTDSQGFFEFDLGSTRSMIPNGNTFSVAITAPDSTNNLSLYEVTPGESRTSSRVPYSMNIVEPDAIANPGYQGYEYHYTHTPGETHIHGDFERNDFGYAGTVVDGGYYEVFNNAPLDDGHTVEIVGRYCTVSDGSTNCSDIYSDTTTTDSAGEFFFDLADWDAGYTNYMRHIQLYYPDALTEDSVLMNYFYHELGNPAGNQTSGDDAPGSYIYLFSGDYGEWLDNDVFYGAVMATIFRRWPVVPPNPDEVESVVLDTNLDFVRRQAVTTTVRYYDPDLGWELYPNNSEVVLEVTIDPGSPDNQYNINDSLCVDGHNTCDLEIGGLWPVGGDPDNFSHAIVTPDCPADLVVPSTHTCIYESTMLNTDITLGTGLMDAQDTWPKDWAYNIFSRVPNSMYTARARWRLWYDDSWLPDIYTDYVTWAVTSHAAPLEED